MRLLPRTAEPILSRCLSSLVIAMTWALSSCVTPPPPFDEYAVARSAVNAARECDSAKFAKGMWNKAEEFYFQGQKSFNENDMDQARKSFRLATEYAERAENLTRLKKFQTGDSFQ